MATPTQRRVARGCDSSSAQEGAEVLGLPCTVFRIDPDRTVQERRADPEFGPVVQGTVTGILEDATHGLKLERETGVRLLEDLPVALFETSYRNRGETPVHLDRGTVYEAYDYARRRSLGTVSGAEPASAPSISGIAMKPATFSR